MKGLLYKDFLCVKGRIICLLVLVQLLLITSLRFIFRNNSDMDLVLLGIYTLFIVVAFIYILFFMDMAIFKYEKTGKTKRYVLSLPVSKKQYVMEKYVFMLIAVYILMSLGSFEGMICQVFCENSAIANMNDVNASNMINSSNMINASSMIAYFQNLIPALVGVVLFICAIEFAFMFALGTDKGIYIKTSIILLFFMLFLIYLFFGDLTIMDKWDIPNIMVYLKEHPIVNSLVTVMPPAVGGIMYAVSYIFSVRYFVKREDIYDE